MGPQVCHLDGVAVARRCCRHLQDVVGDVAAGAAAVADLPPLLPVVQDLRQDAASPSRRVTEPPLATPDAHTHLDHFLFHHRQLRLVSGLKVEFTTGKKLRLASGTERERAPQPIISCSNRKWSGGGREAEPVIHFLSYQAILCYQTCYLGIS